MPRPSESSQEKDLKTPILIKKYPNRRLYNTVTSAYVTLEDLAGMVKKGIDFLVYDAKTSEDLTRTVLTQIIFEQENKGGHLLPISFLRHLIGFYGDRLEAVIPKYLEYSLESLREEQKKLQKQMLDSFSAEPLRRLEDQARAHLTLFQQAMEIFTPLPLRSYSTEKKVQAEKEKDVEIQLLKDENARLKQQIERLLAAKKTSRPVAI